jgi:hypothetical protein
MGMADYSYQSLATMGPQGRWRRVLLIAMIPMAFALIYYSYPHSYIPSSFRSSQYALPPMSTSWLTASDIHSRRM